MGLIAPVWFTRYASLFHIEHNCAGAYLGDEYLSMRVYILVRRRAPTTRPTHKRVPSNDYAAHYFIPMSAGEREATPAISNFTSIFETASNEYKRLTKNDLRAHPFAAQFYKCDSPRAVLDIFREQARAFEEYRDRDDKLMAWLDPTVNIVFALSATLGEGLALVVGPRGISLFGVAAS
jgi:hypothetical protein